MTRMEFMTSHHTRALRASFVPILALALLLALVGVLQRPQATLAATTRSWPSGVAPCNTTLQACINGSDPGDTINIDAGVYPTDEIIVNKSLTLNGAGSSSTIFQAKPTFRVFTVQGGLGDGVVISNLRVSGGNVIDNGGGILSELGTPLTLINVEVRDNFVDEGGSFSGGGVYAAGPLQIINSQFISNAALGGGGGGVMSEASVSVVGSTFSLNRARFGGGLRTFTHATIDTSDFISNSAINSGDGGGVMVDGGFVTITASILISNSSGGSAGGLWAEVNATIFNTTFVSNTTGGTGGGMVVNGGIGRITGGSFISNRAGPLEIDGSEYGGGAIFHSGTLYLDGVTFSDNFAPNQGGAISSDGDIVVRGGSFDANRANSSGGAIFQDFASDNLDIENATFQRNESDNGGAIYTYASLLFTDTDFLDNTGDNYGGALFSNHTGSMTRGRFEGNRTTLVLPGNLVGGGAIYADSGNLTIRGTSFIDNESAQQGGAMLASDNVAIKLEIEDATFIDNRAQSGGAIESAGRMDVSGGRFERNRADTEGGAILSIGSNGPLVITESVFYSNSASYGGGVSAAGHVTVTASSFVSNTASSEGGALASSGHSYITASEFDRNHANLGGALWLGVLNGNDVDRATFTRNSADLRGGAIFVQDSTALTLTNSLLVGNSAGEEGGALASISPNVNVINATFAANDAPNGGAIRILGGNLNLRNSILWENTAVPLASNVVLNLVGPNIMEGGSFGSINQDPLFVRNTNLGADDLGDLRLRQFSPAIDRGDSNALDAQHTLDLDDLSRRVDIVQVADTGSGTPPIDLGAFELREQYPAAVANGPYAGSEGTPIPTIATGSTSGDSGQALSAFAWDCTDDGTFEIVSAAATGSSCLYPDQGTFTLRLRVTDSANFIDSVTTTASVLNVAPALTGQSNQSSQLNQPKSFGLGSFGDPGPDSPWQVTVDWGDGQSSALTRTVTGALPSLTHTYATSGTFNAGVQVLDKDGGSGEAAFVVTVTAPAPDPDPDPVKEFLFMPRLYSED